MPLSSPGVRGLFEQFCIVDGVESRVAVVAAARCKSATAPHCELSYRPTPVVSASAEPAPSLDVNAPTKLR